MRNLYGLLGLAIASSAVTATPAIAEDEYNVTTGYTLEGAGLGVHGADPVVLSTLNAVAPGDAANTVVHDGVAYYFASKLSADRFKADPDRYLPQYGGYCAYALSQGIVKRGDPGLFVISDGRLFLLNNPRALARWQAEQDQLLIKAEGHWPRILKD